jgi:uncharacterized protein (TIGR03435 family)
MNVATKSFLAIVAVLALTMRTAPAQNGQRPEFGAAAIKPGEPVTTLLNGGELKFFPGRFNAKNATLKDLIRGAYRLPYWRILDGPAMIAERYNIEATAENRASTDQLRLMLQTLLADRFKLALHRDSEPDQNAYNLVVVKTGSKLQEVKVDTYTGNRRAGGGRLSTEQMKMADLADWLAAELETSVYDKTGLSGVYKFNLIFTPEDRRDPSSATPQLYARGEEPNPSLFRALQEQLGLKLELVKGPLEVLVIDHAERPTAN